MFVSPNNLYANSNLFAEPLLSAEPQNILLLFQPLLPPPPAELSPGLAALTVGCDSGNLGSLSRVQLLLLDRPAPEMLHSSCSPEEELEDWGDLMVQDDPGFSSAGIRILYR